MTDKRLTALRALMTGLLLGLTGVTVTCPNRVT